MDGVTWKGYEFKYKPGDVNRMPPFVAPHQPRLDWQMWFASLGHYQRNPWYVMLVIRLLEGSKDAAGLLETNPFPNEKPKMIRSLFYNYHFTDLQSGKNGSWWSREPKAEYMPTLTLDNPSVTNFLKQYTIPNRKKGLIRSANLEEIPLWIYGVMLIPLGLLYILKRETHPPTKPLEFITKDEKKEQ